MITKKNTLPSHIRVLDITHQMFHISVQEFKEYVRLSHSWSELARRCGEPQKFGRFCSSRCITTLKQKVLFLKLDTQHFRSMHGVKTRIAQISPQAFTEFVRVSNSWSELASRCGEVITQKCGGINWRLVKVLKQKVLSLNLDTQHLTSMPRRAKKRVEEVGQCRLTFWGRSLIPDSEEILKLILQIYEAYDAVKEKEKYVEIMRVVQALERDLKSENRG